MDKLKKLFGGTKIEHQTVKYYKYERGNMKLEFSITLDDENRVRDMLRILKLAVKEVTADLGEEALEVEGSTGSGGQQ